jgi:polyisoprenoid-binding protein YceI
MKLRTTLFLGALACLLNLPVAAATPETWIVDPVHSTAQFTARHFGIVPVIGTIPIVSASVQLYRGSQIPVAVSAQLDAAKLDTHNDRRDNDLKSPHYFDTATTPTIKFISTRVDGTDPNHFTITGNLTMHGQTHSVVLNASVVGSGKSPRGGSIIAYAATATVDRTVWGMTYGPLVVGNNIDLSINAEADGP